MTPIQALIKLLAHCAEEQEMGHHSYIVGGAPRDFVMGHEVKDVDVVVEPQNGKDAVSLGKAVAEMLGLTCHADHYGVVHIGPVPEPKDPKDPHHRFHGVSLVGQKVEIVTSRKEKYDRTRGRDSHKPTEVVVGTILEDLMRRDFTINTLMWRLDGLHDGIEKAPILDFLQAGLADLKAKLLRTPLDPYETFDDDPTRMLRAIRFAVKYDFSIEARVYQAIRDRAKEITRLPYEALDPLFFDKILTMSSDRVRPAIMLMDNAGLLQPFLRMMPVARMRRAIQGKIDDFRLLLFLKGYGFDVGLPLTDKQFERFRDAEAYMNDTTLNDLYRRFQKPVDVKRLTQATGLQGSAIGQAIARGRDLVLMGIPEDRIFKILTGQEP